MDFCRRAKVEVVPEEVDSDYEYDPYEDEGEEK